MPKIRQTFNFTRKIEKLKFAKKHVKFNFRRKINKFRFAKEIFKFNFTRKIGQIKICQRIVNFNFTRKIEIYQKNLQLLFHEKSEKLRFGKKNLQLQFQEKNRENRDFTHLQNIFEHLWFHKRSLVSDISSAPVHPIEWLYIHAWPKTRFPHWWLWSNHRSILVFYLRRRTDPRYNPGLSLVLARCTWPWIWLWTLNLQFFHLGILAIFGQIGQFGPIL